MPTQRTQVVAFSIRGPIARADLPGLCERVCALLPEGTSVARCDVSGVEPDAVCVDALARLQLAARRRGCCVQLENASDALLDLVELMGLTHVLAAEADGRVSPARRSGKTSGMANYTLTNLTEVEDAAATGGFSEHQEARFASEDLDSSRSGSPTRS
jgi:ABC-type transporter Mla MlaB component